MKKTIGSILVLICTLGFVLFILGCIPHLPSLFLAALEGFKMSSWSMKCVVGGGLVTIISYVLLHIIGEMQ